MHDDSPDFAHNTECGTTHLGWDASRPDTTEESNGQSDSGSAPCRKVGEIVDVPDTVARPSHALRAPADIPLLRVHHQIPVLILTNMGKEEAPANLADLNVIDYIVKAEMTPKQVAEKVSNVLSQT